MLNLRIVLVKLEELSGLIRDDKRVDPLVEDCTRVVRLACIC